MKSFSTSFSLLPVFSLIKSIKVQLLLVSLVAIISLIALHVAVCDDAHLIKTVQLLAGSLLIIFMAASCLYILILIEDSKNKPQISPDFRPKNSYFNKPMIVDPNLCSRETEYLALTLLLESSDCPLGNNFPRRKTK